MTPFWLRHFRTLIAPFAAAMMMLAALISQATAQQPCTADAFPHYVDLRSRLVYIARYGLRGGHYYSITLKTAFDGVIVPDASRAKHPTDITFVLQHQFERLVVTQDRFSVNLWFKGIKSRVTVPFNAITYFVDPSVNDEREFEVDMQLRTCNKPQAG
jgi:hypothetical protein